MSTSVTSHHKLSQHIMTGDLRKNYLFILGSLTCYHFVQRALKASYKPPLNKYYGVCNITIFENSYKGVEIFVYK